MLGPALHGVCPPWLKCSKSCAIPGPGHPLRAMVAWPSPGANVAAHFPGPALRARSHARGAPYSRNQTERGTGFTSRRPAHRSNHTASFPIVICTTAHELLPHTPQSQSTKIIPQRHAHPCTCIAQPPNPSPSPSPNSNPNTLYSNLLYI